MLFKEELSDIFVETALIDILFDYYWNIIEFVMYYHVIINKMLHIDVDHFTLANEICWDIVDHYLIYLDDNQILGSDIVGGFMYLVPILTNYNIPIKNKLSNNNQN